MPSTRTTTHTKPNGVKRADSVQLQAAPITAAANDIERPAKQTAAGTELHAASLDSALTGVNQMSASLEETGTPAESVATSTEGTGVFYQRNGRVHRTGHGQRHQSGFVGQRNRRS